MSNGLSQDMLDALYARYPDAAPPPAPAPAPSPIDTLDPHTAALLAGQHPPAAAPTPAPDSVAAAAARGPAPAAALARAAPEQDRTVSYRDSGGAPPAPALLSPPRPIGYTKAGFVPGGRQKVTEEGVKLSPETEGALEKEQTAAWEIEANAADAAREEQEEARGRAGEEYAQLKDAIQAEEQRKAKQTTARDRSWNELMRAQGELSKAEAKGIDPNRYLHDMNAGSKIMTVLGLFASGFASGMTGRPDEAMNFLKSQIANDVEAQKADLAGKERAYQNKTTLYGMLRQQGLDDETAASGARLMAMQAVQKKLDTQYATERDARTKLGLAQMMQKLEQARAQERGHFDEKAGAKVQTTETERYQPATPIYPAGSGGGVSEKEMGLLFKDPATGKTYKATNEESRKKLAGALDLNGEVSQLSDQYAAAAGKLTSVDKLSIKVGRPTAQAAQAQTLYFQLQGKFRQAANDGVWKKSEAEMLAQQLQPPDVIVGSQTGKQAAVIKQGAQQNTERAMTIERPLPVQPGFGVDAHGRRIPTAAYTGETYAPGAKPAGAPKGFKEDQ